jgi:Big-like domain-containing protein
VDSNLTADFDTDMNESTVTDKTFYLKKPGSKAVIPAAGTFDPGPDIATPNPDADLDPGTTYTAYVKGGKKGVKSADGQKLGGTADPTATFKKGKVSWTFTTQAN